MVDGDWQRLSIRTGRRQPEEALYDGVPDHLDEPVRSWLDGVFKSDSRSERVALRLRQIGHDGWWRELENQDDLLDVLDACVHDLWGDRENMTAAATVVAAGRLVRLRLLLNDGGSAWTVASDDAQLVRRLPEATSLAVETAITGAPTKAATQLKEAYGAVFGRHPNVSVSYSASIKALEELLLPVIVPNDSKATLGKIFGPLAATKKTRPDWLTAWAPALEYVWDHQTDRHGANDSRPPTQADTEQAFFTAIAVCQTVISREPSESSQTQ